MSARLLGELTEWLQTPVAAELTQSERLALYAVAERADENTRKMWRHRVDAQNLAERIATVIGIKLKALGAVLLRLARRGLEVRVPVGTNKRGEPLYAHNGHACEFRLPELPASVSLPDAPSSREEGTFEASPAPATPVDNPPSEASGDDPKVPRGKHHYRPSPREEGSFTAEGPATTGPYPSKDLPSTNNPSTAVVPTDHLNVEGAKAGRREPSANSDHPPPRVLPLTALRRIDPAEEYAAAAAALFTLPDLGQVWISAARRELGEHTPRTLLVIRAHELFAMRASA